MNTPAFLVHPGGRRSWTGDLLLPHPASPSSLCFCPWPLPPSLVFRTDSGITSSRKSSQIALSLDKVFLLNLPITPS